MFSVKHLVSVWETPIGPSDRHERVNDIVLLHGPFDVDTIRRGILSEFRNSLRLELTASCCGDGQVIDTVATDVHDIVASFRPRTGHECLVVAAVMTIHVTAMIAPPGPRKDHIKLFAALPTPITFIVQRRWGATEKWKPSLTPRSRPLISRGRVRR